MTYQETLEFLFSQLPVYQKIGSKAYKKDLSNISAICEKLNHPQKKLRCIHLAGTNGKGSTSHMIASILQEAGYKVGLYTSPHLTDFRERVRINGTYISEGKVIAFVETYKNIFSDISPSFFEWTVGLAFHHFNEEAVDVAVIETGLGGRLDSTNIIHPILSIITNIGYDHTDILGDTLDKIAFEKAGIIKENTAVVIGNDSGQAQVFLKKAESVNAPIVFSKDIESKNYSSDLKGEYQKENIHTASVAISKLKDEFQIKESHIQKGLGAVIKNTGLRGRWDQVIQNPKVVLETAHNKEGFSAVAKQLEQENYQKLIMVLGFVKQKPLEEIIKLLPNTALYILTKAQIDRSEDPSQIEALFSKAGKKSKVYPDLQEAIKEALKQAKEEDLIYIGGSNFVVAEALDFFEKEFDI